MAMHETKRGRSRVSAALASLLVTACSGPAPTNGVPIDPIRGAVPIPEESPAVPPPTGLSVEVKGTGIILSWTPPSPTPEAYNLLVGKYPGSPTYVAQFPGTSTTAAIEWALPRGQVSNVALQSSTSGGKLRSAASASIPVDGPVIEPGALALDCQVTRVTEATNLAASLGGTYEPGSCADGIIHHWDARRALNRIRGLAYRPASGDPWLELRVEDGDLVAGWGDGPYPALRLTLSPLQAVAAGSSWPVGPLRGIAGAHGASGGVYQQNELGEPICLDAVAVSGSVEIVDAAGLATPGQGSFRISGSVLLVDPVTVAGLCSQVNCCWQY